MTRPFSNSTSGDMFVAMRCEHCVHRTAEDDPCDAFTPAYLGEWPTILVRSDATPVGVECTRYEPDLS